MQTPVQSSFTPPPLLPPHQLFQGEGGQIVMEAESGAATGDWMRTNIGGNSALLWNPKHSSYEAAPSDQSITFDFRTDEAGIYSLAMLAARNKNTMGQADLHNSKGKARADTGNDVYVRIVDLDTGAVILQPTEFYAWLGHSNKEQVWGTKFYIGSGYKRPAEIELDADTNYRLEVIGRSDGFIIDKLTLSNSGALRDEDAPESPRVSAVNASEVEGIFDASPQPPTADFRIQTSTDGTFNGTISLTNSGDTAIKGWSMEFDADFEIENIESAEVLFVQGDTHVIGDTRANRDIGPGETVTFSISGAYDGPDLPQPTNFLINGTEVKASGSVVSAAASGTARAQVQPEFSDDVVIFQSFETHDDGAQYDENLQNEDWDVQFVSQKDGHGTITDGAARGGDKSLKITYPDNASDGAGAAWELPENDEYYLSYWLKFEDDFDFNGDNHSGGKLPGLAASGWASGGDDVTGDNGFTARYMWREDGKAELYLYHMDKPSKWGDRIGFKDEQGDDVFFEDGTWHNLVQRVQVNDTGRANGEIDVWMDGSQVVSVDGLRFQTDNSGIDSLYMSTFYGGSGSGWWPDQETQAFFDDFLVTTNPDDVWV
ncbi:polysaccharide lyase [Litoreibacter roseus]|uniref:CBM2 domain-containing protein n=1 Tax=Litoreibacter roseus TaxID=2601869 RepID=A0A6N6JAW9_9RHOB|nr:cellulose binding domain-containing protein [Litoreibacter roseus]GFE63194.1 hypothetical protein KIN_02680 [Litoreibacter roseus]